MQVESWTLKRPLGGDIDQLRQEADVLSKRSLYYNVAKLD